jgi:predicted AlkP superfamily phosphohydrolase/phosphomutase
MVEDHNGLTNGRFDEEQFLAQCTSVLRERERMMCYELDRFEEGLFFCLFDTPDRLQHMFWRFREPEHPANRGEPDERWRGVIEEHYRACDAVVGQALARADDRTITIALSDHGFGSFQRGVHLNGWLHAQGLLTLKHGTSPTAEAGDFLRHVDWGRTKAYALGLGGIYLNLAGREADGIVSAGDARRLGQEIAAGLTALHDEARGQPAVSAVVAREDVYSGPCAADSPDLIALFQPGYRVSWSTALGGMGNGLFEDNTKRWGGDHIVDPIHVPGVLFIDRPFHADGASLLDLAPTILAALGVPKGSAMEGKSLQ